MTGLLLLLLAAHHRAPPAPTPVPTPQVTFQLVKKIPCGMWPKGVELSLDGRWAITSDFFNNTLTVVSTTSLTVARKVKTGKDSPVEINFLADGKTAVIPGGIERDETLLLDLETFELTRVGGGKRWKFPKVSAASPDGKEVWITYWESGTVGVYDSSSWKRLATVKVGKTPRGIAFTPDGKKVYVADFCELCGGPGKVEVIDAASRKVITRIQAGKNPRHVVVSPDGKSVYVSLFGEESVLRIDPATDTIAARAKVGKGPKTIKLSADGKWLFVANFKGDSLMAVDTESMTVAGKVKVGHAACGLALSADGKRLWSTDWFDGRVRVFDLVYPTAALAASPEAPP